MNQNELFGCIIFTTDYPNSVTDNLMLANEQISDMKKQLSQSTKIPEARRR